MPLLMKTRAGEDRLHERVPKSFIDVWDRIGPKVERVSRKHLLVLKGDEDPLVPWSASREFVESLPRERATVKGYEGVGHALTQEMVTDTAAWIRLMRERL